MPKNTKTDNGPVPQLVKALNKSLKDRADSIDPASEVFMQDVLSDISQEVEKVRRLNKPNVWKRIYAMRDKYKIRMEILNRIMSMGGI